MELFAARSGGWPRSSGSHRSRTTSWRGATSTPPPSCGASSRACRSASASARGVRRGRERVDRPVGARRPTCPRSSPRSSPLSAGASRHPPHRRAARAHDPERRRQRARQPARAPALGPKVRHSAAQRPGRDHDDPAAPGPSRRSRGARGGQGGVHPLAQWLKDCRCRPRRARPQRPDRQGAPGAAIDVRSAGARLVHVGDPAPSDRTPSSSTARLGYQAPTRS